jgi:hypothetical protein
MSAVENKPPLTLIAGVLLALLVSGAFAYRRHAANRLVKRKAACRALAIALDKTVRGRNPRVFESIVEDRWDRGKDRCLAALEYHYKPCDAKLRESVPALCEGPDADIGIYTFEDGGARPIVMCERKYDTGEGGCSEPVYGEDGSLISSREVPADEFPRLKAELFPAPAAP